jgi:putative membrane-bound dehydrogenase-like protein
MGDYPLGMDGKGKPGGIVRFLEDTNGDGIYDKSAVFLEGVNFPNGIYPWRKGVIISAAPEIFYAEDSDGDGKADVHKTLFTGFNEGNQQHRANGFDYGLDGWLYGANGDSGGDIQIAGSLQSAIRNPQSAISISGRDFRFNPANATTGAIGSGTTTRRCCGTISCRSNIYRATRTYPSGTPTNFSRNTPMARASTRPAKRCNVSTTKKAQTISHQGTVRRLIAMIC